MRILARVATLALIASCQESAAPETARFHGRAVQWASAGGVATAGLRLIVQDTLAFDITNADGSFDFPSVIAQQLEVKFRFEGTGAAPAVVRAAPNAPVRVVLTPTQIAIPTCSVHGGTIVPLNLEAAFRRSSPTNTSFFDRANTQFNNGRIVVASWKEPSIPVALSDTGAGAKQFTSEDSVEVRATLDEMTAYFCHTFHFASVAEATARGVVLHKDPLFVGLGAHSMALPTSRGDYERALVVVRRVAPVDPASRDTIRRTIMHEFLHVLGMGHTCSWPSVMTTGTLCEEPLRSLKPSPEDVAHYFAMIWARDGERNVGTTWSIANAYVADAIGRGMAEPNVRPYFTTH